MKSKRLILLLLFMMFCMRGFGFCQKAEADTTALSSARFQDAWFGEDKAHHFMMSFMLTWWGTINHDLMHNHGSNQAIRAGAGFSFALGLAKEIRDSRMPKNRFSLKDLAADLLGIGLAVLLMNRVLYVD